MTPRVEEQEPSPAGQPVYLTGVSVPFGDLVWLLVKLSLAAVPAAVILAMFSLAFWLILGRGVLALR